MTDINAIVNDFAAVWNEPDAELRRAAVVRLWDEDAIEYTTEDTYRGHDELEKRVAAAYEQFVSPGESIFVAGDDVRSHHGALIFTTHLVPVGGGSPQWSGTIVLLLTSAGRIERDYQFPPA
ncbi:hypothetical protein [Amycolatopsis sp. NBC_01480]|jgi:hypothetical protein|uniref:hypothetical protein n=1 Tax=Amycolatopsis sp. NBC_01480 TaxID=2903562 RepID=UPI002E284DFA|nr:hypothetical protein [Amycolatopsis sp. NBC_01480]